MDRLYCQVDSDDYLEIGRAHGRAGVAINMYLHESTGDYGADERTIILSPEDVQTLRHGLMEIHHGLDTPESIPVPRLRDEVRPTAQPEEHDTQGVPELDRYFGPSLPFQGVNLRVLDGLGFGERRVHQQVFISRRTGHGLFCWAARDGRLYEHMGLDDPVTFLYGLVAAFEEENRDHSDYDFIASQQFADAYEVCCRERGLLSYDVGYTTNEGTNTVYLPPATITNIYDPGNGTLARAPEPRRSLNGRPIQGDDA